MANRLLIFLVVACLALGLAVRAFAMPLQVDSTPPGGAVFLDDEFVGTTPVSIDLTAKGPHLFRIERRGYEPWRQAIDVGTEPLHVQAELHPQASGSLLVATTPAGADVYVDGRLYGKSPVKVDALSLQEHTVQLAKTGYELHVVEVTLSPKQPTADVNVTLKAQVEDYLVAQIAAHPDDVMSITDLAHEYALQHRFDECLATLGRAFDAVSQYGEALDQDAIRRVYMEVDRLYEKQFDYAPDDMVAALRPRLVGTLRAAIQRAPKNGYNYESLAACLAHESTQSALEAYEAGAAAADALPVRIRLLGSAGTILYQAGAEAEKAKNWQAAADAYEKLVQTYPELWCSANALNQLVEVYGEGLKDPHKALGAARRLVAGFPKDAPCVPALSRAAGYLAAAGETEQATALAEEIGKAYPQNPSTPGILLRAAKACQRLPDGSNRALALLRIAIDISDHAEEGAEARREAAALLQARGDRAGADALVQEILTLYPLSIDAMQLERDQAKRERNRTAARAYQQAATLSRGNDPQAGVTALEAVVQQYPETYFACVAQQLVVSTWIRAKDYEKAVAAAQQFAERWPDHPDAPQELYRAANWLASTIGDPQRAIEAYQRVVDAYPTSPYADHSLFQLGQLLMQTSQVIDYQKAMDTFVRLTRDFPDSDYAQMARKYAADCQMQLRETDKAREAYLQLMTEDPNGYVASLAARMYQTVRMRKEEPPQP
jgi:tetratricopeptide (TPR) repeat protein